MSKSGRRRQDHLARKAQAQGYHARSVFKLEAIQEKFTVLPRGGVAPRGGADLRGAEAPRRGAPRVLDLGAAPGSWTQFVVEQGRGAVVLAVDLQEMSVPGATCLQGDFTDAEMVTRIAAAGPFDLVLSDAAPATTGNRVVDTGRSEALVESIMARLPEWLTPGGNLVCKLFQGGGEQALLRELRRKFAAAHLYRPQAVRKESFETYLVGLGYTGVTGSAG